MQSTRPYDGRDSSATYTRLDDSHRTGDVQMGPPGPESEVGDVNPRLAEWGFGAIHEPTHHDLGEFLSGNKAAMLEKKDGEFAGFVRSGIDSVAQSAFGAKRVSQKSDTVAEKATTAMVDIASKDWIFKSSSEGGRSLIRPGTSRVPEGTKSTMVDAFLSPKDNFRNSALIAEKAGQGLVTLVQDTIGVFEKIPVIGHLARAANGVASAALLPVRAAIVGVGTLAIFGAKYGLMIGGAALLGLGALACKAGQGIVWLVRKFLSLFEYMDRGNRTTKPQGELGRATRRVEHLQRELMDKKADVNIMLKDAGLREVGSKHSLEQRLSELGITTESPEARDQQLNGIQREFDQIRPRLEDGSIERSHETNHLEMISELIQLRDLYQQQDAAIRAQADAQEHRDVVEAGPFAKTSKAENNCADAAKDLLGLLKPTPDPDATDGANEADADSLEMRELSQRPAQHQAAHGHVRLSEVGLEDEELPAPSSVSRPDARVDVPLRPSNVPADYIYSSATDTWISPYSFA